MKRLASLLLALCLLPAFALAERAPMKLWDVDSASSFWREHRGIKYERVLLSPWEDRLTGFQSSQVDAALLRLYHSELQPFVNADVLADLSQNPAIREAVSRMPPWIQAQVTTRDGRIIAAPTMALVRTVNWYQDAWDAAGLTEDDVPQSFTGLLDFLDAWVQRIEKKPDKRVCVSTLIRMSSGNEKYDYVYWLTDMLLTITETQQRHAGEAVTFSTPQFTALAERCRQTGLALYKAEPRKQKRQGMLQLFQSDLHGGEHANGGRSYGLSHTIPLRLTDDQPALTIINMEAHVLRKDSPYLEEGLLLLDSIMQSKPWFFKYALYADFQAGDYSYDSGRTGHIDEGWLRDYHAYEGEFVFYPRIFDQTQDGTTGKEALMQRFFQGELDAEAFAGELDDMLH